MTVCKTCKHANYCEIVAGGYSSQVKSCRDYRKGEMTNEEWLRSATTEQLVHVIHLMTTSCFVCGSDGVDYKRCYFHKKCTGPKEIEEWLKQPHTFE